MTNKPMLSVERDLLERFVSDVEAHNYGFDGLEEMRALLDEPVDHPNLGIEMMRGAGSGILIQDHGAGWEAVTFNRGIRVSSFPIKGGYKETVVALKAVQHQGEPVAWQYMTHPTWDKGAWPTEWTDCTKEAHDDYVRAPLVADWEYRTRKLYAEQPAPVAVVMPFKFEAVVRTSYSDGWNEALAEVARLNGVKPELDTCRTMVELFPDSAGGYYNGCPLSALSDPMQCWRDGYEIAKKRAIAAGLKVKS